MQPSHRDMFFFVRAKTNNTMALTNSSTQSMTDSPRTERGEMTADIPRIKRMLKRVYC